MKLFASLEATGSKQETSVLTRCSSEISSCLFEGYAKGSATISVLMFNRFNPAGIAVKGSAVFKERICRGVRSIPAGHRAKVSLISRDPGDVLA
jgi:hypothetical protein